MSAEAIEVRLPTHTIPSHEQWVVGKKSPLSSDLEEFRGIPFGFVPGRWKHSEIRLSLPLDRYDASHNGPKCPQMFEFNNSQAFQSHLGFPNDVTESEFECLNLFIIRPSEVALKRIGKATEQLPVLLWIHGGGFGFGAGTDPMWDPSRLVLESISLGTPFIAVNLNYRLNLLGFAASSELLDSQTGDQRQGCNFGLRDQRVGIQWVSRNISHFGGDPKRITIGGQSAGAASVHAHALSSNLRPEENPLFRRAIMQSGSLGCLGPSSLENANRKWDTLCTKLGCESGDPILRLEKLRTMPVEDLVTAQRELQMWIFDVIIDDKTIISTDQGCDFLVDFNDNRDSGIASKKSSSHDLIEVLLGDTELEGSLMAPGVKNIRNVEQAEKIIREAYPSSTTAHDILKAYEINHETPLARLHQQLFHFVGDSMFGSPLSRAREIFSSSNVGDSSPAGHNRRPFRPTRIHPYKVKFGNPWPGPNRSIAHHCVELIYLFDAFHDELLEADRNEAGIADQSPPLIASVNESVNVPATNRKTKTNAALIKDIQKHWIDFITSDNLKGTYLGGGSEDTIIVYDTDREARRESLSGKKEWVEQEKRFEVLRRYPEAVRQVHAKLASWSG